MHKLSHPLKPDGALCLQGFPKLAVPAKLAALLNSEKNLAARLEFTGEHETEPPAATAREGLLSVAVGRDCWNCCPQSFMPPTHWL
jgi:hypothetical protein